MRSRANGPSHGTSTNAATISGRPTAPRTRWRGTLLLANIVSGWLTPGVRCRGPGRMPQRRRSASNQAAPALTAVTPSTEGQVPTFLASGCDTPIAVQ